MDWPPWWDWQVEFTPHLLKRMQDRTFSEADLRMMLEDATGYRPAAIEGRFVIEASRDNQPWEVVVEPDEFAELLVVVTAYPVTRS